MKANYSRQKQNRLKLEKQLEKESHLVRTDSMIVNEEFDSIEYQLNLLKGLNYN